MPEVPDFSQDINTIGSIDVVPSILELVKHATGMRFAAIARVTESRWIACAIDDDIAFGLEPGDELPVETTICREVRQHLTPVAVTHASEHATYSQHHMRLTYELESCISVPIISAKGEFFGTLCALDPVPAHFDEAVMVQTLKLHAQLIAMNLDLQTDLRLSQTALADAHTLGRFRDQFVAVLGHDLRTPLTAVRLSADMLAAKLTEERDLRLTGIIQHSAVRMATLIENVLELARGELGGGIAVEPRWVAGLTSQLQGVIHEVRIAYPHAMIEVTLDVPAGENTPAIYCDPVRVCQLLSNLLENAIIHGSKASPVELLIATSRGDLILSVLNQGVPIPPELIPLLFKPFSRSQGPQRGDGLGLGLYIANEICTGHNGTLKLASNMLDGTCFTATLPCSNLAATGT